jgi:signal recognition particle subunit SRP54
MFENLTNKLQRVFKDLRGEGKLTEEHLDQALEQIRTALLEGDVNLGVVKALLARIREKALGQEVLLSLSPDQQVLKIVRDELTALLGNELVPLKFSKKPPTFLYMVGLQGSGKTTSTGKLAKWLSSKGHRPVMISTDVRRPAAREQLKQIANSIELPVVEKETDDVLALLKAAKREAEMMAYDVILVDTAGRLHIDDELMEELTTMRKGYPPTETLFVADAMTGQDAVKSAGTFHERIGITGVMLTKMDGDARGGAAISVGEVTGQPIKFIGVGEKYDALEPFHPDRIVGRILGMGDMLTLIEKAEATVDKDKAADMEKRLRKAQFTLEDFRDQLKSLTKMGGLDSVLEMIPGVSPEVLNNTNVDERRIKRLDAIISSMTPQERNRPEIIKNKRRKRIARGSGTTVQDVNQLLKQFKDMTRMLKSMTKGGKRGAMQALQQRFTKPGMKAPF